MVDFKRAVAKKIRISEILESKYVRDDGDAPSYILTPSGDAVSRVNVVGVVIEQGEAGSVIIDDGSGRISARVFSGIIKNAIGDFVLVIGRPREFGNDKYISAEILKTVSKDWADLRKKELVSIQKTVPVAKETRNTDFVINVIRNLDKGDGASYDEIVKATKDPAIEKTVSMLLEQGMIFQVKPGKLKVL